VFSSLCYSLVIYFVSFLVSLSFLLYSFINFMSDFICTIVFCLVNCVYDVQTASLFCCFVY
jgi:hypothetical protein